MNCLTPHSLLRTPHSLLFYTLLTSILQIIHLHIVFLDTHGEKPYNFDMEWNDKQTKIAKALSEQKTVAAIVAELKVSEALVYKVRKALKKAGGQIPSSNDRVIPTTVVKKAPHQVKTTDSVSETSLLEFAPRIQSFAMTPDIFMSYMCALMEGYKKDLGQWLSLVSRDFWLGRGRNFYAEVANFDPNDGRKRHE